MLPDAECIRVISEALQCLNVGPYTIKLNHRLLLDGIFATCGVPNDKFHAVCSSIDKLDKNSWSEVKREIVEEKGLSESSADKIGTYVSQSGGIELIYELKKDNELMKHESAVNGLESIELLFKYCKIFQVTDKIIFDLSLARGLDYYTGIIFEAILTGKFSIRLYRTNFVKSMNVIYDSFKNCIFFFFFSLSHFHFQAMKLALVVSRAVAVMIIWLECSIVKKSRFLVSVYHWASNVFSTF